MSEPYQPRRTHVMGSRIGGVRPKWATDKGGSMTHDEAIRIVALRVARDALEPTLVAPMWENYPEIGEHDWERVSSTARSLVDGVSTDPFREAYALLEACASNEATESVVDHYQADGTPVYTFRAKSDAPF